MNRYIHVIYCDDIRMEIGNKQSLMGMYVSDLLVPEVPVTIPKLCIHASLITPASEPFRSLTMRVLKDDEVLMEVAIPPEQLRAQEGVDFNDQLQNGDKRLGMNFSFVLSPFVVDRPFKLRVRAQTESEELKGSALDIKMLPPDRDAT